MRDLTKDEDAKMMAALGASSEMIDWSKRAEELYAENGRLRAALRQIAEGSEPAYLIAQDALTPEK